MQSKLVINSTVLIALEELSLLSLLSQFTESTDFRFVIPENVFKEVSKGNPMSTKILKNNRFDKLSANREELNKLRNRYPNLGNGELEVITIAKCDENRNCIILTDDKIARSKAVYLGLVVHGTIWFLEQCCNSGILSKEKTLRLFEIIGHSNFRIDKKIILEAKQRIM